MHDKGISIDGEKMVRGGRNVEDGYFGRAKRNFIDRDAYVEGKVVRDSDAYFEELWNSDQVSWLAVKHFDAPQCTEGCRIIDDAVGKTLKSKKWKINTGYDWGRGLPTSAPCAFCMTLWERRTSSRESRRACETSCDWATIRF